MVKKCFAELWHLAFKNFSKDAKLTILMYHSVNPTYHNSVSPASFEKQLQYLLSNFDVISIYELIACLKGEKGLDRNSIALTFDDGYEDNYLYAYPILKKYGCQATIFVCTGLVDGSVDITVRAKKYKGLPPLNWEQIRKMADGGIIFGAHGHSHENLSAFSKERAVEEILTSKNILQDVLCKPIDLFSYPWGQHGFFNDEITNILKENNFVAACSTIWGTQNRYEDLYALKRIRIDPTDSMREFILKVNGAYDFIGWIHQLKGII